MKIGNLEVTFHRTVRVADGRTPSNLPPSLGRMKAYKVSDYKANCPADWDSDAVFVALHNTEALWLSFHSGGSPVAALIGAGGINAINGEKLGTMLQPGNYIVTPPQPWLDGWKSDDGCVYQFVATPYQKGDGKTVAEQLIGAESKTGAIGIAVFEPKDRNALKAVSKPITGFNTSPYDSDFSYGDTPKGLFRSAGISGQSMRSMSMPEMGVGKGGKITQKIYPDPYGLEVWQDAPVAAVAIYLVSAEALAEITGDVIPKPRSADNYGGPWFGLQDEKLADVQGTNKFSGLKSAFIGDTENVKTAVG